MAEDLWEQQYYGDYCKHGTNVGTPGGADLMCGYCEMGLDRWVDDPRYALYLGLNQDVEDKWRGIKQFEYRESTAHLWTTRARLERVIEEWSEVAERADITLYWQVHREDGGYWDE